MKKSTYSDDHIVLILQEAHKAKIPELAKRHGVCKQNGFSWLGIGTHKTLRDTSQFVTIFCSANDNIGDSVNMPKRFSESWSFHN